MSTVNREWVKFAMQAEKKILNNDLEAIVVVVGLPLLFLGMEVWHKQLSRFMPST